MTEFKLANKKPNKSNSSAPVPQQPPPPTQQQQQYSSSSSYQLPSFTPMQSFPTQVNSHRSEKRSNENLIFFFQNFTPMNNNNNFQDNNASASLFPHYNGYSLSMPHNNVGY